MLAYLLRSERLNPQTLPYLDIFLETEQPQILSLLTQLLEEVSYRGKKQALSETFLGSTSGEIVFGA